MSLTGGIPKKTIASIYSAAGKEEDFQTKAVQEAKEVTEIGFFVVIIAVVAYAIATNQSALNSTPPNPWIVSNGVFVLDPTVSMCIGTMAACMNQSKAQGITKILSPVLISNKWLIDQVPTGIRVSYVNETITPTSATDGSYLSNILPLVFFNDNGGVLLGQTPELAVKNLLTLTGTPTNTIVNGMWHSTSSMAFRDPDPNKPAAFIDSVCHVLNASICGRLFRSEESDPGLFWSANRVIFGEVDYGVIVANLESYILFNSTMVVLDYSNYGAAVPCVPNPSMQPPESKHLWMDVYTSSTGCTVYTERVPAVVITDECIQASTMPAQLSPGPYLKIHLSQTDDVLNISSYPDSNCASNSSTNSTFPLGCSQLVTKENTYVYFRINVQQ